MPDVQHNSLSGSELHEPKGVASATSNQTYVADGAGSGAWSEPEPKGVSSADAGMVYEADGAGSGTWIDWPTGWGFYEDNTSSSGATFNTTPAKLSIDGGGSQSNSTQLPREIRGSAELWDTTLDKVTPIGEGDAYEVRLTVPIASKTGSPSILTLDVDISGLSSPTTVITSRDTSIDNTAPFDLQFAFPIFIGSTAATNGVQFFFSTDTGSVTLGSGAEILIVRLHGAN